MPLAEPLGSAEPRLKNTGLGHWTFTQVIVGLTPGQVAIKEQLWASCSHPCASVTKQNILIPTKGSGRSMAGKVIIGLVSHHPCIRDLSDLSTYRLNGLQMEMNSPPILQRGTAHFTLPSAVTLPSAEALIF